MYNHELVSHANSEKLVDWLLQMPGSTFCEPVQI